MGAAGAEPAFSAADLRKQARERLEKKRDFKTHAFIYLLVNAVLVGVWAIATRDALFWPIFPMLAWGIGGRRMPGTCSCAADYGRRDCA